MCHVFTNKIMYLVRLDTSEIPFIQKCCGNLTWNFPRNITQQVKSAFKKKILTPIDHNR